MVASGHEARFRQWQQQLFFTYYLDVQYELSLVYSTYAPNIEQQFSSSQTFLFYSCIISTQVIIKADQMYYSQCACSYLVTWLSLVYPLPSISSFELSFLALLPQIILKQLFLSLLFSQNTPTASAISFAHPSSSQRVNYSKRWSRTTWLSHSMIFSPMYPG